MKSKERAHKQFEQTVAVIKWLLGENHWLNLANSVIALLFATWFLGDYYDLNQSNIDAYPLFIFGDTALDKYSKLNDLRLIFVLACYWLVAYALVFCVRWGIERQLRKHPMTYQRASRWAQWLMTYREQLIGVLMLLLTAYSYFVILRVVKLKDETTNAVLIGVTVACLIMVRTRVFNKVVIASQLPLVLIPLLFLHETYVYYGEIFRFDILPAQRYFLAVLCVGLMIGFIRDWRTNSQLTYGFLFMLAIFSIGAAKRFYLYDEYHYGEMFTAFHQIIEQGQMAYVDFVPVKGYGHVLIGALNRWLFGGGYLTFSLAIQHTILVYFSAFFVLTYCLRMRKLVLLVVILTSIIWSYTTYLPALFGLLLLSHPTIYLRHHRFLCAYVYLSVALFYFYNAFGAVFTLALMPLALYHFYCFVRMSFSWKQWGWLLLPAVLLAWDLSSVMGSIQYLLVNSEANLFYWGNQGALPFFVWHNLWLAGNVALLYWVLKRQLRLDAQTLPWVSFFAFAPILLLSYMQARADGDFLRALNYTNTMATFLMIFAVVLWQSEQLKMTVVKVFALGLLGYWYLPVQTWFFPAFEKNAFTFSRYDVNAPYVLNRSNSLDTVDRLGKLGNGFVDRQKRDELILEAKLVQQLAKNEAFLMLDSDSPPSVRYVIYDKKVPMTAHSAINVPSLSAWQMEVEKLRDNQVKIIRVSSETVLNMVLYNALLDSDWQLVKYGDGQYLIESALFTKLNGQFDFERLDTQAFFATKSQQHLVYLPMKWGSAITRERANMIAINEVVQTHIDVTPEKTLINYQLSEPVGSPAQKGNIVTFSVSGLDQECVATLNWREESGMASGVTETASDEAFVSFFVRNGDLAVPLGVNYKWMTSASTQLQLAIFDCEKDNVKVSNMKLYQY